MMQKGSHNVVKRVSLAGLVLILMMSVLPAVPVRAQDDPQLAFAERGPYAVGTQDRTLGSAERPLDVTIWYPAVNPDGEPESITYTWDDLTVTGTALRDASPDRSGAPYPLVLFSHGHGGFRLQSLYLTEHLASYGFVVIALDHPGNTVSDRLDETPTDIARQYTNRPLDVLHLIDDAAALSAGEGPLAGLIDTERVIAVGHSFGGYTALAVGGARLNFDTFQAWCRDPQRTEFDPSGAPVFTSSPGRFQLTATSCFLTAARELFAAQRGLDEAPTGLWPATSDSRIKAVVALAPWNMPVFGPEGLGALDVPVMIQVGTEDGTTIPERDAYAAYRYAGSDSKSLVAFEGADHLLFVDASLDVNDSDWDLDVAHPLIKHLATAFVLAALGDNPTAEAALALDAVNIPGVEYLISAVP